MSHRQGHRQDSTIGQFVWSRWANRNVRVQWTGRRNGKEQVNEKPVTIELTLSSCFHVSYHPEPHHKKEFHTYLPHTAPFSLSLECSAVILPPLLSSSLLFCISLGAELRWASHRKDKNDIIYFKTTNHAPSHSLSPSLGLTLLPSITLSHRVVLLPLLPLLP